MLTTPIRCSIPVAIVLLTFGCDGGGKGETDVGEASTTAASTSTTTGDSTAAPGTSSTSGDTTSSTTGNTATSQTTTSSSASSSESTAQPESSSSSGGLILEGDPPPPASFSAIDDANFGRLPDDDEFTDFSINGNRLQIIPLRDENFPADVDYCTAGSDEVLNEEQQWARARLLGAPKTWYYDVTITMVAEEDGESEFGLAVDGRLVGTTSAPPTASTPGVGDMDDATFTWEMVPISAGSEVEVWGRAHSNFALEEAPGCRDWSPTYAWARGRWRQLDLVATPGV